MTDNMEQPTTNKSVYVSPSLKEIELKSNHCICQASGGYLDSYKATTVNGGDDFED